MLMIFKSSHNEHNVPKSLIEMHPCKLEVPLSPLVAEAVAAAAAAAAASAILMAFLALALAAARLPDGKI